MPVPIEHCPGCRFEQVTSYINDPTIVSAERQRRKTEHFNFMYGGRLSSSTDYAHTCAKQPKLKAVSHTRTPAGTQLVMELEHPAFPYRRSVYDLLANGVNASVTLTKQNGDVIVYTLAQAVDIT